ncbi:MAG: 3-phosphoserine/phosphohydroxythreonine transaminase [Christensenellales bacterium]|jgi:phosphoserine aminotransferase
MDRVYNFAAGPSAMPLEALETAAREMTCYGETGMSVMEMSHRSKMYTAIFDETIARIRSVMHIPDTYEVLALAGGATGQFAAIPMNLMTGSGKADYVDSGNFAHGALVEAQKYGNARAVASSKDDAYRAIPHLEKAMFDPEADYAYITTNNTIYGTRYAEIPDVGDIPLVADMSSNILSEVYDIEKFGVVFAGAQKNIGPAGMVLVIVRKDLLGKAMPICPKIFDWAVQAKNGSMVNTPATYPIYMANLCLKWLEKQGGVEGIEKVNIEKADMLYRAIDESSVFKGVADKASRSRMNITFRAQDEETDAAFVKFCQERGLINLKGHRVTGGIRASIYNAMPVEGVKALIDAIQAFEVARK